MNNDHFIQLKTIEAKASDSEMSARRVSMQRLTTTTTAPTEAPHGENESTPKENWKILNQKMQLQKLIERLTRLQSS